MSKTTVGGQVDMKLEVVVIPISDTDRAQKFYSSLGWRQDVTPPGSGVFQFTPPGSGALSSSARTERRPRLGPPRACG